MKFLLPVLLATFSMSSVAESLEKAYAPFGRLIFAQFVTAPFPHPSRAQGHQHKDKFLPADKHYSDSTVAIFIPKGFRESKRVDVVMHFHGWGNSVEGTLRQFKLIEQFVESRRNAVLVVPEGPKNASDSSGGKLEDLDGFKRFSDELTVTLRQQVGFHEKNWFLDVFSG